MRNTWRLLLAMFVCIPACPGIAHAEPYIAVREGLKCIACHVNPTGGGLRNGFGVAFAETAMPANALPANVPTWTGNFGDFLRAGGDLRASWTRTEVPGSHAQQSFNLDQTRVYADVSIIPDRLEVYLDELVAPQNATAMEAYARFNAAGSGLYVKAGHFYLPFGWRLQDQTAFVREATGISMTTPDTGVELGLEREHWSVQVDLTNGAANAGLGSGHQVTSQAVWIVNRYRLGAAASSTQSDAGNRRVEGLFAGLRTGPLAWLGEVDLVRDAGFPEGARSMLAALGEADWLIHAGHNLKLTVEYLDPDRRVPEDQQNRWSLVYEYSPLPFLQLRTGFRRYQGIPQSDLENRRLLFLEVHGFM